MTDNYRPRLSIDLSEEQYKKLSRILPWGTQRHLFSAIVDDIIAIAESGNGEQLVAAIIAGILKPREVLRTLNNSGGS